MSLAIIVLIIIVVAIVLLCWGVDQVSQFAPFSGLIKFAIIVLGVLFLLNKAGVV